MTHLSIKMYAAITAFIFLVVATLHLFRLFERWDIMFGTWEMPLWASVVGLLVAGYLAYEGFMTARRMGP